MSTAQQPVRVPQGGARGRGDWRSVPENRWNFDVAGYVHLTDLLDHGETQRCAEACRTQPSGPLAPPAATEIAAVLENHEGLLRHIDLLFGDKAPLFDHPDLTEPIQFRLDQPPALLRRDDGCLAGCLDRVERRRLRYDPDSRPDIVTVRGLRILWALDATSEVVIVPASHKTDPAFSPPPLARIEELDAVVRPPLRRGDALICAATTLVGLRPSPSDKDADGNAPLVLELVYADARLCAPGLGYIDRPLSQVPEWFHELSEEQQAIVGPREGRAGAPVATDGQKTWLASGEEDFPWQRSSGLSQHDSPLMSAEELWMWDTQGYIVAPHVMDSAWLEDALAVVDKYRKDDAMVGSIPDSETWSEKDCSATLLGSGGLNEERMGGLEALPLPDSAPFRRMIGHPAVVARINWSKTLHDRIWDLCSVC